ncbi:MAG: WYL domain-containing protein, partial [Marmoricola sp.]
EDALTFVQSGIRQMPQRYAVRVLVGGDPDPVVRAVGHWGTVEPDPDRGGCVLTMNVDSLQWPMMVLAQIEADFEVESPPELRTLLGSTAQRFARATS